MKIYISADIEGIAGISHWDEATLGKQEYDIFQEQMTREVIAACEGATAAGATEIIVKDAHDTGRNLDPYQLPLPAQLIRGWSGHPYSMVQELNSSFSALVLIGYHSRSGSGKNPLAHTLSEELNCILLNDQPIAEFHLVAMTAAYEKVPVVFVSGDSAVCEAVKVYDTNIETVATKKGIGESVWTIHPEEAVKQIQAGVERALQNQDQIGVKPLSENFKLEVEYNHPPDAYENSFYPGAKLQGEQSVLLETDNWFEVIRALCFIV
ncbi:amino acid amidase [Scytonema tolypothrichoides VB-61278]|nr:amino acid amidase [Scytonema tolypothrichoides VB-61278]